MGVPTITELKYNVKLDALLLTFSEPVYVTDNYAVDVAPTVSTTTYGVPPIDFYIRRLTNDNLSIVMPLNVGNERPHRQGAYTFTLALTGLLSIASDDPTEDPTDEVIDVSESPNNWFIPQPTPLTIHKEYRPQPTRIACFYDTSKGQSEIDLIDAYYNAHGLEKFYFGYDLSTLWTTYENHPNSDATWADCWNAFGSDFYDYINANNIDGICISPNCPNTVDAVDFTSGTSALSLSQYLGKIRVMYEYFDPNGRRYLGTDPITSTAVTNAMKDVVWRNLGEFETPTTDLFRFGHDEYPTSATILKNSVDEAQSTFSDGRFTNVFHPEVSGYTLNGFSLEQWLWPNSPEMDTTLVGGYSINRMIPVDREFDGWRGRATMDIPAFRIGYPDWANGNHAITPAIVTSMVTKGLALKDTIENHAANSYFNIECGQRANIPSKTQLLSAEILESLFNWQNITFGVHRNASGTALSSDLTPTSDNSVTGNVLTSAQWGKYANYNDPTTNTNIDYIVENQTTALPTTTSERAYDSGSGFYFQYERPNGGTFPLPPALIVSSTCSNYIQNMADTPHQTSGVGAIFDWSVGGLFIGESSNRHRDTPGAFDAGLTAAWGSQTEPGSSQVGVMPVPIINLVRGHTAMVAFSLGAQDPGVAELWGDGLFQPFADQALRP